MAITKPSVGATGWNTAVDAVIDAVNGTTDDIKELARDALGLALTAGSNVTITPNDGGNTITISASSAEYGPPDQGFQGWTIDPAYATNGTTPTAGVVYLQKIKVVASGTCDTGYMLCTTAGTSPTNGYFGLYDATGARIAVTANQASNWGSAGVKAPAWASPVALTAGQIVYFAHLTGGGTPPTWARAASQGTGANGVGNLGLSAPGFRFGTILTGQTSLPSSITLSSVAGDNAAFLAAIST